MKTKTVYQCDYCLESYNTEAEARKCEMECLKLTADEYKEYLDLLEEERWAFALAANASNDEIRERCHDVVKRIIAFAEKHHITSVL